MSNAIDDAFLFSSKKMLSILNQKKKSEKKKTTNNRYSYLKGPTWIGPLVASCIFCAHFAHPPFALCVFSVQMITLTLFLCPEVSVIVGLI